MADTGSVVSGVAERYASALFDLARDENALDEVAGDLGDLSQLLDESEDLRALVRSPIYSADEQAGAIGAVMARAGTGILTSNFVKVVARNRRLFALPDMIRSFRQRHAQERGELAGTVTSAEPLSDTQLAALRDALKDAMGKDVVLDRKVDASLIGGLVVQVGSRMVDTSLRTKLNALRFAMKEAG